MASAIDIGNPDPERSRTSRVRLPLAGSRLGRLILLLNILGLVVIIVGALIMNEFTRGLVEARLDSLSTQAQLLSYAIVNAATEGDPEPSMNPERARTILKVSSEIVRQQDAFLAFGVEHLRPLNLKTVADAIGMHESTVSRVTSNKYISTPRGLFELKFFFTSSIASSDGGEAHSAESVRHKIKQLIDGEADGRYGDEGVLSDDRIVEILKAAGIEIARRTVAKYREALRIPSSVERKRQMRLAS